MRFLWSVLVGLVMLASVPGWGQPDPANPPADPRAEMALMVLASMDRMPAMVTRCPEGILLYRNGLLVKIDPTTLEEVASLELFGYAGPLTREDVADWDSAVLQVVERLRRVLIGAMAVEGKALYLATGSMLFRIDLPTMQVTMATTLLTRDPLADALILMRGGQEAAIGMDTAMFFIPAQLEVTGTTVEVVRDKQIILVNGETGEILGRRAFPADLAVQLFPPPRMFPQRPVQTGPVDGQPYPIAGRATKGDGGAWTFVADDGMAFRLIGDAGLRDLDRLPDPKTRVLLDAVYSKPTAVDDTGSLTVRAALALTHAPVEKPEKHGDE